MGVGRRLEIIYGELEIDHHAVARQSAFQVAEEDAATDPECADLLPDLSGQDRERLSLRPLGPEVVEAAAELDRLALARYARPLQVAQIGEVAAEAGKLARQRQKPVLHHVDKVPERLLVRRAMATIRHIGRSAR